MHLPGSIHCRERRTQARRLCHGSAKEEGSLSTGACMAKRRRCQHIIIIVRRQWKFIAILLLLVTTCHEDNTWSGNIDLRGYVHKQSLLCIDASGVHAIGLPSLQPPSNRSQHWIKFADLNFCWCSLSFARLPPRDPETCSYICDCIWWYAPKVSGMASCTIIWIPI